MASTRNCNTAIDYNLEQNINTNIIDKNLYQNSAYGRPTSEFIPAIGYIPSHMSRDTFANNSIDIESSLYGIGATNLVKQCEPVQPSMRSIDFKDFFDRKKEIIMPFPMVYNNGQRPFPI